MRKSYASDISLEQFEAIREELVGAKKRTHPRKYDLYDLFCAVLYLLTVIPTNLAKALQLARVKVGEGGTAFPTLTAVSWRVRFSSGVMGASLSCL